MATTIPSHVIGVIPFPKPRAVNSNLPTSAGQTLTSLAGVDFEGSFEIWTGQSGSAYAHTVYDLRTCPAMPACTYVLVRKGTSGHSDVVKVGRVENDASSLNLAEIRRRASRLGADEVHLHLLASSANRRSDVVVDLASAIIGDDVTASTKPSSTH